MLRSGRGDHPRGDDPPPDFDHPDGRRGALRPSLTRDWSRQVSPNRDAAETLPATDPAALMRLERFGGRKLVHEMIGLYLKGASERIAAAAAGLAANDAAATGNAFHALKSSSAQLGAMRLAALCEQGELIARSGMLAPIGALLDASREELVVVEAWLDRARAECPV